MTAVVSRPSACVAAMAGALAAVVSLLVMSVLPVVTWPVVGGVAGTAGRLLEWGEAA